MVKVTAIDTDNDIVTQNIWQNLYLSFKGDPISVNCLHFKNDMNIKIYKISLSILTKSS